MADAEEEKNKKRKHKSLVKEKNKICEEINH